MLSSDLRRKLAKLNIEREREGPPEPCLDVQREREGPPEPNLGALPRPREREGPPEPCLDKHLAFGSAGASPSPLALEDVVPGRVHARVSGELYIVERKVDDLYPAGKGKIASCMRELRRLGSAPEDALFLDIETCGLANCPLFLIGTMSLREGDLLIEQFFARDYAEEAVLLEHLIEVASPYRMFVTFNGKSFDIPYMRDRMVLHRIRHRFEQEHLDLLIEARRRWRDRLPDCKLQTLEEHICGRRRFGDTPGHLIPQLYHDFVRTGNAAPLEGIFHHNALDIITMAELLPAVMSDE
jgi:uncharacterized protein YprB with RNaseH-like and TPR domain